MRRSRMRFYLIVGAAILFVVGFRVIWPSVRTDTVHIQMIYSSEEQPWIDAITPSFNAANHRTASGRPIQVTTLAVDSGESLSAILQGTEQPTLWSPASQAWIGLINAAWTQQHGQPLIAESCGPVVNSPIVIMMWKADAVKLGWPTTPIGWADILTLASAPDSTFRFAHTRPDDSDSGLQAMIGMTYAAAHKQSKLTLADVNSPEAARFVNALESSVVAYGNNSVALSDELIGQGSSFASAAVGYESSVVETYNSAPEAPLVAIYPKEGTPVSDHPACIPNANWIDGDQKDAATVYRDYLLSEAAQRQALQFGLRPTDSTLTVSSPIDTTHGVDPTQPQVALPMPDTTTIQAILELWRSQKRQVNLTLLTDISGNMLDDAAKFPAIQQALTAVIDRLDASATVSVIAFDDQQHSIISAQSVGPNRQAMENKIRQLVVGNGTTLYDSLIGALKTAQADPRRNNVLVLVAGAGDTSSKSTLDDVLSALGKAPVAVYTIGYGAESDNSALQQIANAGHGLYYKADATTIQQVYQQIVSLF